MFEESILLAMANWPTLIDRALRVVAIRSPMCAAAADGVRGVVTGYSNPDPALSNLAVPHLADEKMPR